MQPAQEMDPKFNGEWSAYEFERVKSLIASHNLDNNYGDGTNNKHNDIANDIQALFPWKERHQVIEIYVDLVVEMMILTEWKAFCGGNQHLGE
jgi:hypothetical protein